MREKGESGSAAAGAATEVNGSSTDDAAVGPLLDALASADPGRAWRRFLDTYAPLVMHVVRRHETYPARADDCFAYVCAALSDDGFARLRRFRAGGTARFRTWLMAVVANLCIDWQRREHGRARPFRAITRLPDLEQRVYHCLYVRGMRRVDCLRTLEPSYPGLTHARLAEINAQLFALLTPQQRWQLGAHATAIGPLADGSVSDEDTPGWQAADPAPGPEEFAQAEEELARLRAALARLPAPQRLLLRLRFEQDLTLAEVARLTRQPDPFRANRQIQAALADLADLMQSDPRKTP